MLNAIIYILMAIINTDYSHVVEQENNRTLCKHQCFTPDKGPHLLSDSICNLLLFKLAIDYMGFVKSLHSNLSNR